MVSVEISNEQKEFCVEKIGGNLTLETIKMASEAGAALKEQPFSLARYLSYLFWISKQMKKRDSHHGKIIEFHKINLVNLREGDLLVRASFYDADIKWLKFYQTIHMKFF